MQPLDTIAVIDGVGYPYVADKAQQQVEVGQHCNDVLDVEHWLPGLQLQRQHRGSQGVASNVRPELLFGVGLELHCSGNGCADPAREERIVGMRHFRELEVDDQQLIEPAGCFHHSVNRAREIRV
ncbi:hypothetical protein D3C81_1214010 [compost metagenome]